MPKQPTDSAKNVRGDSDTFTSFMRRLMQVPHSEIKEAMDTEKERKRTLGLGKRLPSSRRSTEKPAGLCPGRD